VHITNREVTARTLEGQFPPLKGSPGPVVTPEKMLKHQSLRFLIALLPPEFSA